jgi:DNA-binding HxlR family transcriptional regulator
MTTMKLQKETLHGRWYYDACGTAFAMELIGERWTLLIVRELMFGARRFSDLRAGLPAISARVLTERLEGMERAGIVQRARLSSHPTIQVYELTPWGYQLEEPIKALGYWAAQSPCHDPALPLSAASLMMSLRTMYRPPSGPGRRISGNIAIGPDRFFAKVGKKGLRAGRGSLDAPDFTISAPGAEPLAALIYGKVPAEDLAAAGLVIEGSADAAQRFVSLFSLPEKHG